MRVGIGYDVHPLVLGRGLILGGVEVPFEKGLSGHSDADVLTHAIIDALLGALALKDIGTHFSPHNLRFKDISSLTLLREVGVMVRSGGFEISNIDATVVAQRPKLAPFIETMRLNLSQALDITIDKIGVKATTSEGLGFTGREEGIAAYAVALVEKVAN